jgi:hypothetical protein
VERATVATRYDKRVAVFDGTVQVASIRIRIRLRDLTSSRTVPCRVAGRAAPRKDSIPQSGPAIVLRRPRPHAPKMRS